MNLSLHFEHCYIKNIITIKKKKKKREKKKKRFKYFKKCNVKNIVIKKNLNTSHLMCLKIFV